MPQLEALRKELNYLKNCVHRHQNTSNRFEWELLELESWFLQCKESLDRDLWKVIEEVESLKESSYYYQGQLWQLNNEMYQLNEKIGKYTQLHSDIKRALMAFSKKCAKVVWATLRLANEVREEDLKLELLVDWEMDNYDADISSDEDDDGVAFVNNAPETASILTITTHESDTRQINQSCQLPHYVTVTLKARAQTAVQINLLPSSLKEGYLPPIETGVEGVYMDECIVTNDNNTCNIFVINTCDKDIPISIAPCKIYPFQLWIPLW